MPGTGREQIHILEKSLCGDLTIYNQHSTAGHKLIRLCRGFGESWNSSFKQKHWVALAAGAATHKPQQSGEGANTIPSCLVHDQTHWGTSHCRQCFSKGFGLKSCIELWKMLTFQAANGADTVCFPFLKRNWEGESSVSSALKEHAKHKLLWLTSLNAATPVTLLIPLQNNWQRKLDSLKILQGKGLKLWLSTPCPRPNPHNGKHDNKGMGQASSETTWKLLGL